MWKVFVNHACYSTIIAKSMATSARCFIRLATDTRSKVVLLPDLTRPDAFSAFKERCAAKLGLPSLTPLTLLLASNHAQQVKVDLDAAPEIEALDEVSPEDFLIVVPRETNIVHSSEGAAEDEDEDEPDKDDEDAVEVTEVRTREQALWHEGWQPIER